MNLRQNNRLTTAERTNAPKKKNSMYVLWMEIQSFSRTHIHSHTRIYVRSLALWGALVLVYIYNVSISPRATLDIVVVGGLDGVRVRERIQYHIHDSWHRAHHTLVAGYNIKSQGIPLNIATWAIMKVHRQRSKAPIQNHTHSHTYIHIHSIVCRAN